MREPTEFIPKFKIVFLNNRVPASPLPNNTFHRVKLTCFPLTPSAVEVPEDVMNWALDGLKEFCNA
jgi:hypothetical protein